MTECLLGEDADHQECIDPSHINPCCYHCCDVCIAECLDPEYFGVCDVCQKPYKLASRLDHNPETGVHYECETGWFTIDLTGTMRDEVEQVLLDMLYAGKWDASQYNQVALMDALTIIEEAEEKVFDRY